ncbi:MAG: S8 family serine peptidase, partial [Gemmatimonadetes bacterium]|nr:S8 family serine peptidase [Gemmatimonadota bacterium]
MDDTDSATTSYLDEEVEAERRYVYRVKARNSAGLSGQSNFFNAYLPAAPDPPGPPANLTATASGETLITLSWDAPADSGTLPILGYRIEASPDVETGWTALSANTASAARTYAHDDLSAGATWYYRVSAITAAGTGDASSVASATTADNTPPALRSGAVSETGDTLDLTFDEALDLGAGKAPPASAFAVTAGDAAIAVAGVSAVAGDPRAIRLTGLTPAITQGLSVSVSYTDPTAENDAAAIQDLAGNDTASFGPQAVANGSTAAPSRTRGSTPPTKESLPDSAAQQIAEALAAKARRTPAQRKVSSQLLGQAAESREREGEGEDSTAPDSGVGTRSVDDESPPDIVKVDIRADVTEALIARITLLGGTVINSVPRYREVRALLPISAVEQVAALDAVDFIRAAEEAYTRKSNTSQGDIAHRANTARTTHSVTGAGIGIGVISNGVNAQSLAQRQATGDIPADVVVLSGQEGVGNEGTAMLEIVHDLAPGAQLYFATGFTGRAQFAANIEALCDAGANVIVDDVAYYLAPTFQDGIISKGVNAAVADGCYYFSSAGNDGSLDKRTSSVWEGDFSAGTTLTVGSTSYTRHAFATDRERNELTSETGLVALFQPRWVVLQWADPLGSSSNDYDLFLFTSGGVLLAQSTNTQDGTQDPIEALRVPTRAPSSSYIVVARNSGAAGRYLRLFVSDGDLALTTAGNTYGHAAAENTIGVGQVDVRTAGGAGGVFDGTESVGSGSADGPRRIFFTPNGTPITAGNFSATGGKVLNKPDLSAASCVRTATPGFSVFCGTSAAAPHAAAIAALAIAAAGGPGEVTLAELRTAMTASSAVLDIEGTGTDRNSGAGIVMAPGAIDGLDVAAASRNDAPTVATAIADRTASPGASATTIDISSTFSDPESDTLTYSVSVSDPDRLTVSLSGTTLTLTPGSPGNARVWLRAADPTGLAATDVFSVTVSAGVTDYDRDNDNLIEVSSLAQLDAIRYDLNGDGVVDGATWRPFLAAYPMAATGMGCPAGCTGYELAAHLDFDTNASGAADAGDTYWNSGSGWDPIGSDATPFTATFDGNGRT